MTERAHYGDWQICADRITRNKNTILKIDKIYNSNYNL